MMKFWIWFLGLALVLSSVDCRPKVKPSYPVPPPPRSQPSSSESLHEWAQAPVQHPDVQEEDAVYDPDVGDAGLTAIKDIDLDACFIYHYKRPFVLPAVQRAFYVENLPATFTSTPVDKVEFLNSVGPLIGRECADKMCFWLDNGLFYQYMTRQLRSRGNGPRVRLNDHIPQASSSAEFAVPPPPPRRREPLAESPAPAPLLKLTTSAASTEFAAPPPPPKRIG